MKRTKNDRIDRNRELTTEELKHVSGGYEVSNTGGPSGGGTGTGPLLTGGGPTSGGSGGGPTA